MWEVGCGPTRQEQLPACEICRHPHATRLRSADVFEFRTETSTHQQHNTVAIAEEPICRLGIDLSMSKDLIEVV